MVGTGTKVYVLKNIKNIINNEGKMSKSFES